MLARRQCQAHVGVQPPPWPLGWPKPVEFEAAGLHAACAPDPGRSACATKSRIAAERLGSIPAK